MTPLEAATDYARRGLAVIPVPHRSKNPGYKGWEQTRFTVEELPAHFNGKPQNVGVLLGEPSRWLIDVDLDHSRCVERADAFLPATPAQFGRPGKPRSHRLYRVAAPVATKKHKSKSAGMLVELRSTGMQTIFPPSTHESGEPIAWEPEAAKPALVEPEQLLDAVQRLADAVRVELGERPSRKPPGSRARCDDAGSRTASQASDRVDKCVAAMLRMQMPDHHDGSGRLFAAACRVVEHDLNDALGLTAVREYARQRSFPVDWTDADVLARIRDAEKKTDRGVIRRAGAADGKRRVLTDTDEHRVVTETVDALSSDETIFQRGSALVRVVREHPPAAHGNPLPGCGSTR